MKLFDCFNIFSLSQKCEIAWSWSGCVLYKGTIDKIPITYGTKEIISISIIDNTVIFEIDG